MKLYIKTNNTHTYSIEPVLENKFNGEDNFASQYVENYIKSLQTDFPKNNEYCYFISTRSKVLFNKAKINKFGITFYFTTFNDNLLFKRKSYRRHITAKEISERLKTDISNIIKITPDKKKEQVMFYVNNEKWNPAFYVDDFLDTFNIELNNYHHITYIGKTNETIRRPSNLSHHGLTLTINKLRKRKSREIVFITFFTPNLYACTIEPTKNYDPTIINEITSCKNIALYLEKLLTAWFQPEFNNNNTKLIYKPSHNFQYINEIVISIDISCDDNSKPNDYYTFVSGYRPKPVRALYLRSLLKQQKIIQELIDSEE